MGHLMEESLRPGPVLCLCGGGVKDVALGEGDQPRILHRPQVVLRHEDLIVLAPGVGVGELAVEEVKAAAGEIRELFGVEMRGQ